MSERDALIGRLDAGWRLIDEETDPAERARLTSHWLKLLKRYERQCDCEDPIGTGTPYGSERKATRRWRKVA